MKPWRDCPTCRRDNGRRTGRIDLFEGAPGCGDYVKEREIPCPTCQAYWRGVKREIKRAWARRQWSWKNYVYGDARDNGKGCVAMGESPTTAECWKWD